MVRRDIFKVITSVALLSILVVWWRFEQDMNVARINAARGSVVASTRCGLIEYQEAGTGLPLLMIHGSGGGHDQGMAFAGEMALHGIRVIAISRFGYLRTPMADDSSPAAQADANVCLLDFLRIPRAAVLGGSAGAPSAMQMAISHPERVSALVLLVPLAWRPVSIPNSSAPMAPWLESVMMRVIGSDFLFWAGKQLARDLMIRTVLATPPERVAAASVSEQARVDAMLDRILPVSARAAGLRSDSTLGKRLTRYELESIRAPTLIVSAVDDGYGTFATAQYLSSQLPGSTFVRLHDGGHTWVGHDAEVQAAIRRQIVSEGVL